MLSHAGTLAFAPPLQRCTVSSLHPYAPVERSPAPMSPVPEPPRWTMGDVPLSARGQTLLVSRLQAHLQRSDQHPAAPEQAVAAALDPRDLSTVPRVLVSPYRQRGGYPYPYQLSVVLVAAQCGLCQGQGTQVE